MVPIREDGRRMLPPTVATVDAAVRLLVDQLDDEGRLAIANSRDIVEFYDSVVQEE